MVKFCKETFLFFSTFFILSVTCVVPTLPKGTSIVIIGAGPAGYSALARLLDNGYTNVILLEGNNRIGGRIYTIPFADSVFDLGGM